MSSLYESIEQLERRVARLESFVDHANPRLDRLDQWLDHIVMWRNDYLGGRGRKRLSNFSGNDNCPIHFRTSEPKRLLFMGRYHDAESRRLIMMHCKLGGL